jgi:hypothetical protein
VAAPGASGPTARLLALLAPWLEALFPADLARRGASTADRLTPSRSPALCAALEGAAAAFSARPHVTLLTSRPGLEIVLENTQPPAIVFSAAVGQLPEPALPFLAARSIDLLQRGWALAGKFAPRDVAILLELACRFAGGSPPSLGLPAERAGAFLAALRRTVPPGVADQVRELASDSTAELPGLEPRALVTALRQTANRAALLYAGDPGEALRALALLDRRRIDAEPLDPVAALALPDLRDLAEFALSELFLELRMVV